MAKKKVGKNKAALAKVLTARVMLKKVDKPVVIVKRSKIKSGGFT